MRKKRFLDFDPFKDFFDFEFPSNEGSSTSISITQDSSGEQIVDVKTSGNVDKAKLRERLRRQYPGTEIRELGPSIEVTGEKGRSAKPKEREEKPKDKHFGVIELD